jgi:hypothetical protein
MLAGAAKPAGAVAREAQEAGPARLGEEHQRGGAADEQGEEADRGLGRQAEQPLEPEHEPPEGDQP